MTPYTVGQRVRLTERIDLSRRSPGGEGYAEPGTEGTIASRRASGALAIEIGYRSVFVQYWEIEPVGEGESG